MIDLRTLVFAQIFSIGFFSAVALRTYRHYHYPGAQYWGLALVAQLGGWVFYVLRPYMPEVLSVVAGNGLFYLALLGHAVALDKFINRKSHVKPFLLAIALLLVVLFLFTTVWPNALARVMVFNLSASAFVANILWGFRGLLSKNLPPGPLMTALGFAINGLAFLLRGLGVIFWPAEVANLFTPGWPQEIMAIAVYLSFLMYALGYMIMLNERLNQAVMKLAVVDPLTQIYNRRMIYDLAEKEISLARRYGTPVSVLVMDIDKFKRLNDTYGHAAGDLALQTVANLLRETLRRQDALGRIGGEEFIALLPNTTQSNGFKAAERVRFAMENLAFTHEGITVPLTISIGVAELLPDETKIEQLVHRADLAMYAAKKAGRNRTMLAAATGPLALPAEK